MQDFGHLNYVTFWKKGLLFLNLDYKHYNMYLKKNCMEYLYCILSSPLCCILGQCRSARVILSLRCSSLSHPFPFPLQSAQHTTHAAGMKTQRQTGGRKGNGGGLMSWKYTLTVITLSHSRNCVVNLPEEIQLYKFSLEISVKPWKQGAAAWLRIQGLCVRASTLNFARAANHS